ncbi:MAG: ribosomal L7Ae/L30e/S12e/Gadd45 family protein [Oscillospiraceae bacterium]|nr:ribosomal L7Ae/L30e/S12e/Gadd45 family protein [Oscillospiraceae bacterium]
MIRILGLAKKAGLLAVGTESVSQAARLGKAAAIISASDASERSIRQARMYAEDAECEHIAVPYTKFELGQVVGRGSPGMLAILDVGLANKFITGLDM